MHCEKYREFYVCAFFCCITLLFFNDFIFFKDKYIALRDTHAFMFPWREYVANVIRGGEIPLWDPYTHAGNYHFANPGNGVLYPLNIIFYIFPTVTSLHLWIVVHFCLAGIAMYYFVRRLGLSLWPALISGVIYMFNGCHITRLEFLSIFFFLWTPVILILLFKAFDSKRNRSICLILIGVAIAVEYFGIGPTEVFQSMIVVGAFWIIKTRIEYVKTRDWSGITYLPIGLAIGFLLFAIQFFPTTELMSYSHRSSDMPYDFVTKGSVHPLTFIHSIIPYFWGLPKYEAFWGYGWPEYWANTAYVGIFCLNLSGILNKIFSEFFHQERQRWA